MPPEKISDDALAGLIVHYTPLDDSHSTPLQRQTLAALKELKEHRPCEHGVPRKFCTGVHKES